MLTLEQRNKWAAALRSGDYTQGNSRLKSVRRGTGEARFCSLGVLADTLDPNAWHREDRTILVDNVIFLSETWGRTESPRFPGYAANLPNDILDSVTQELFMKLNDVDNKSFEEIADVVDSLEVTG